MYKSTTKIYKNKENTCKSTSYNRICI